MLDVNQLLSEEKHQADLFLKRAREVLEPIYIAAAEKLIANGIVNDPSECSAMLYKIFGKDHEHMIRDYLPSKYKRDYVKDEKHDRPRNLQEEVLKLMRDVLSDMLEAVTTLYRKVREEPQGTEKYNGLIEIITTQFAGIRELQKRIEEWKNLSVELAHLKELQDERQKIGPYEKIMLKIQLLFINKDHVAKMIKLSSKWIKNGVERDERILNALNKIRLCPQCMFDIADYYHKQVIKLNRGEELDIPPVLQMNLF